MQARGKPLIDRHEILHQPNRAKSDHCDLDPLAGEIVQEQVRMEALQPLIDPPDVRFHRRRGVLKEHNGAASLRVKKHVLAKRFEFRNGQAQEYSSLQDTRQIATAYEWNLKTGEKVARWKPRFEICGTMWATVFQGRRIVHMEGALDAERVYKDLLWQDRDRMSGAVCFFGSRIPVSQFFESLIAGESIEDFNATFPQIGRGRLEAVLELGLSELKNRLEAA